MKKKITVQIPCLNEEATIGKVISKIKKKIPGANIIVYDNGSSDDSLKIIKKHKVGLVKETKKEEKAMLCEECF